MMTFPITIWKVIKLHGSKPPTSDFMAEYYCGFLTMVVWLADHYDHS